MGQKFRFEKLDDYVKSPTPSENGFVKTFTRKNSKTGATETITTFKRLTEKQKRNVCWIAYFDLKKHREENTPRLFSDDAVRVACNTLVYQGEMTRVSADTFLFEDLKAKNEFLKNQKGEFGVSDVHTYEQFNEAKRRNKSLSKGERAYAENEERQAELQIMSNAINVNTEYKVGMFYFKANFDELQNASIKKIYPHGLSLKEQAKFGRSLNGVRNNLTDELVSYFSSIDGVEVKDGIYGKYVDVDVFNKYAKECAKKFIEFAKKLHMDDEKLATWEKHIEKEKLEKEMNRRNYTFDNATDKMIENGLSEEEIIDLVKKRVQKRKDSNKD